MPALNKKLPAFAAERRNPQHAPVAHPQLSIDISFLRGVQQQTRRPPLLLSIDGTDGQTDVRTLDRYTDPVPHSMRAASIGKKIADLASEAFGKKTTRVK